MWILEEGRKRFRYSLGDNSKLEQAAKECQGFIADDEDEIIDDTESCQNCAYRRWSEETIYCMRSE